MKAILALEDGTLFQGVSFTGPIDGGGEVIFNTGMTGYQEILTDPSYCGQMITMTYPLIGNYGVNPEDVESSKVHVAAFITKECCKKPSNWRSTMSLPDYLTQAGVPGIEGVDTRALTRHIRIHGAMRGFISTSVTDPGELRERALAIPSMEGLNLVEGVCTERPYRWTDAGPEYVDLKTFSWKGGRPKLVVYDYGIKWNIHRLLEAQGFEQLAVPFSATADEVRALGPDAVFLSNGPGDPAVVPGAAETTRSLCEDHPMAGICLGHQILGLALGGTTYKLDFGHHGCNHPVMDMTTEKIEISSQNHGFCVDITGLDNLTVTHKNLNDGTLEGFAHKDKPIIAIQYHPEAAPGPHDSRYFFKRFRDMVRESAGV
ncbi:MAG: glutamine-hydrolyzing carbamoyl-phosphate synthase small subunit [Desulfovibrionaceae bacterium]